MDRDEYFRILDEPCCYNIENFVLDSEWASISGLSNIIPEGREDELTDSNENTEDKKINKKDKNVLKLLEYLYFI
jgi:hypothetical protein